MDSKEAKKRLLARYLKESAAAITITAAFVLQTPNIANIESTPFKKDQNISIRIAKIREAIEKTSHRTEERPDKNIFLTQWNNAWNK